MNLLGAILYDPSSSATKACTSNIAMTAFDTTNLRLAITVPSHGYIRVKLSCAIEGAATYPQILLGVMDGATVRGRISPQITINGTALATTRAVASAEFTIAGLTPGAMTLDAAYGVEFLVASSNIRYGGPNNTTASDAWGGFQFEIWDPKPAPANWSVHSIDASGRVDVIKVAGTTQTAGDLKASLNTLQTDTDDIQTRIPAALVSGRMDSSVGAMAANVITATAINADAITDAKVASDVTIASVTGAVGSVTGAVGSVTGNVGGNVTGSVGSVATGGITTGSFAAGAINAAAIATDAIGAAEIAADAITEIQSGLSTLTAAGVRTAIGLASANLDTQLDALPTNAELTTALAGADDAVLAAIAALNNLSEANVRTAIGLATANLDTQLDALPTNSELTAALASADDATLAAVAALNNLSSAQVQTAAAAALTAYDPPTRTEATADKDEVLTAVGDVPTNAELATALASADDATLAAITSATSPLATQASVNTIDDFLDTEIAAIKAKTDQLTFTVANELDVNIKSVADTGVTGTGTAIDPWSPDV